VTADDEILFTKHGKSNMIPVSSSPFHVTQHAGRDGKAGENFNMLEITLWCDDTNLSELTKEKEEPAVETTKLFDQMACMLASYLSHAKEMF